MKKIVNKLRYTLLLGFIAIIAFGNSLDAATLQVCQGTNTSQYIPMWLYRFDDYWQKQQMIYPSSSLTQMQGNKITALTFYANGNISSVSGGVIEVSLGTTSSTTFSSSALITGLTKKATFAMNSTVISGSQLTITLDSPYEYNGGNLVIEFNKTTNGSGYQSSSFAFLGVTQSGYTSIYTYKTSENGSFSNPSRQRFLPQVTFTYEAKPAHDLGIALSAPATTGAGNTVTLTATVTNNGTNAESGYTVTFRDGNNNVIDTQTGGSLAVGADATFTTTYTTTAAQVGQTLNFTATVACTGDGDATNNNATASTSVITLPPPENVAATAGENQTATVTWDPPIISATTYTWDFETSSQVNDWTLVDSDGDGYNWQLAPYNTDSFEPHGGTNDMSSASFINNIGALTPDNWMISPEVTLGGTFTFWAKGTDDTYYAENFGVFVYQGSYSSGTTGFVQVGSDYTATNGWVQYTINLTQYSGQGRIAIRHYGCTDKYWLLVDDIEYNEPSLHLESYNVYLDGTLVGNVSSSDPRSFTFNNLSSGTHQCAVSAVYTEGESALVPANIPTFTPFTDGTVSPSSVDFGAKNIGGSYTATVTVSNTGNQAFTPTIDATGLPQGITVSPTTSGSLAGGGTLDLTVTFTPTAETSYSGSFTVTIPVPDGDDIVVTVNLTGSGYVIISSLTSNMIEVPVYKSEAKADGTFVFSKDDVDDDIDMSLSYGSGDVSVEVLVKDDEPISSYDLRHKVGSGNWASVATATQDASNPKIYTYNNETFTIPSDATQMWLSMTDEGVDATSTIYFVPVTVANGVVTQGNTYGAPQVTATTVNLEPTLSIGGSKSAGRPGGHWDQTVNGSDVDYCVYTPVISISPVYPEGAVPYLVRAWLLKNEDIPFFTVTREANANDNNTHIVGGAELTYPHPLGEMELSSEMIGGPLTIGYDWTEDNAGSAGTTIQPNAFAAPSEMSQGEISIAVRVYYYKADATQSGQKALRDGSEAPADGYGYGEGNGSDEGIPTAVSNIYTDRQVVDVKYVNTIGMQSDKPFDGVNIVVTRYSDGSITTTKVLK